MDHGWTCAQCGEIIGVYEPVIVAEGTCRRLTGRLTEPRFATPLGVRYHAACWTSTEASAETPLFRV
jgi:hypothetical protein